MKQIFFCLKSLSDIDDVIQKFNEQFPEKYSSILVSIFSGWRDESLIVNLANTIHNAFSDAVIVGSTTSGEIFSGAMSEGTTVVNFMVFTTARLHQYAIDFTDVSAEEGASSLVAACENQEDVAGIEVLIANNDARTYAFLAILQGIQSKLPLFGGVAGSTDGVQPFVFTDGKCLREGIVAILFTGRDLHIHVETSQGWCPLGPWFNITHMMAENVILKLDNKPAILVYEKYLGLSREDFARENLLFPLFLERNGHRLLRLPASASDDGALVMSADCRLGERVRLAYGAPGEILQACNAMHKNIAAFKPQGIVLFNCVTRRYFLQNATDSELQPFQDIAPCAGFYTGGEVSRMDDGDASLLNMSLVAVAFREGGDSSISLPKVMPVEMSSKSLKGTMKLVHYLTHFISVTSNELEQANLQLAEMATMDRLTGLYNRGEIETILQNELSDRREEKKVISGIMMDIDDFKKVNDSFGHDVGDNVLRWAGHVLRKNIRRSDAAGRWGGEEFLILMPGTSLDAAKNVAERIRQHFAKGFTLPNGKNVTASLGVAEFNLQGSYMDFYKLLDAMLYRAKHEGKNRFFAAE